MENRDYLFVYGLFRDQGNNLLGEDSILCGRASIKGILYKVDSFYPGYVDGNGLVWGDVYLINKDVFPALDEYEGEEYEKVEVKTSSDLCCTVYKYKLPVDKFEVIGSGDWMLR